MVTSQATTGLKRCMKNESPNMGYKLFALTDCTSGYTWDFFIYEGKSCSSQSEGLSYESVMALVDENMLGSGYKLFVDKFYTSPTLFSDLLCKKVWACGPVWANRAGFPKTTVNRLSRNAPRGTMRWIRNDELLFVEWKDSKEVQMCSTFHKAYEGDTVQRKVKGDAQPTHVQVPIPAAVLDYKNSKHPQGLIFSTMDPKKSTENGVEDSSESSDEDTDICDRDSVASSVDSTAEEMFMDGLDPVLDRPSCDIYTAEEDCDLEENLQQRKRSRLSFTSSTVDRDGRERDGFSAVSTERWQSSDEADVEPLQLKFTPLQEPGPQTLPNRFKSPLQFFQLLFPRTMMQSIVGHTNDYGTKCKDVGDRWLNISLKDLKSYIALVIYTFLMKCSLLTEYWNESQYFSPSFPAQVMSYQKFVTIANALHFSNTKEDEKNDSKKGTAAYERLGKIIPLYQVIREACKTFFHPFQNITIEERIVAAQPRTGLKRRIEKQSADRGYKLFALTDCTSGYTWDFFIYEGKSCSSQSEGLSYESVMALVDENMLGSGYKLFVDKFYTSPTLFRNLLGKKVWACGPVLPTRKGFPKNSVNRLRRNAPRGTMRWIRNDELLFVEWKDSKEVQMCSTFHKAYEGDTVQRKVKGDAYQTLVQVPIPAAVLDYNRLVEFQ
ncbi:hypothetical protein PO909_014946 [Leuciscus waleckii]